MKMRIKGNSIRLRLSRTEAEAVAAGRAVRETTAFPGGATLSYVLEPSPRAPALSATFLDHQVIVAVPLAEALAWAGGTAVALQGRIPTPAGELSLLVEKDFTCLKPRQHEREDESDLFPNPNEAHGHCT